MFRGVGVCGRRGFVLILQVLIPLQGCGGGLTQRTLTQKSPSGGRAVARMSAGELGRWHGQGAGALCHREAVGSWVWCPAPRPHSLLTGEPRQGLKCCIRELGWVFSTVHTKAQQNLMGWESWGRDCKLPAPCSQRCLRRPVVDPEPWLQLGAVDALLPC